MKTFEFETTEKIGFTLVEESWVDIREFDS
jgi:hypothetical protein